MPLLTQFGTKSILFFENANLLRRFSSALLETVYKFENKTSDVEVDVTDIVKCWILGDIKNNGFLVKFESEGRSERSQSIKFYSSNTNTIYSPILKACYVDYVSGETSDTGIGSGSLSGSLSSFEFNIPTSSSC